MPGQAAAIGMAGAPKNGNNKFQAFLTWLYFLLTNNI
jgi:hypothetical protein